MPHRRSVNFFARFAAPDFANTGAACALVNSLYTVCLIRARIGEVIVDTRVRVLVG